MAQKDKFEKQHDKELAQIQNKIGYVYEQFVKEVAAASGGLKNVPLDKPFRLKDYPLTEKRIEKLLEKLSSQISTFVVNGVRGQWTLANEKNNELCNVVFGDMIDKLTKEQRRLYYNNNDKALDAFLDRKEKGMNLSQRVWRYVGQSREQIESTLELGIKTGESADQMARNLKEYLVYPDKLFRRVRGADGELHLSKAAADFHPGAGVMRSSYKNALRLAATENNIAYRTADHIRHTQLSFIVGIEIHLSKNHTLNGKPFTDICDDLKGKYPKWFHFEGWHPWCRCYQTTILKTPEEVERDLDGADRGSVNAVEKVPDNYKTWVEEHREKIDAAETRGTLPYFLSHNRWTWDERAAQPMIKKDALTVAVERHALRTPEQVEEIKARWQERYYSNHYAEGILGIAEKIPDLADYDTLNGRVEKLRELYANGAADYGALRAAAQRVSEMLKDIRTDLAYLDNPLGVMTEWGIGKAGEVNGAVAQKLSSWQMQGYSNSWLKGKLEFEIKWLEENKKHSTWKVAQDAYKKALDELQTRMYWQASGVQSMIDAYPKKLQAISRYDIIAKIKAAYKRRDVDEMAEVLQEAKEAIEWHERETVEAEPYLKGKYHTMLSKLDAVNNMTYIADIQNALKKKDINAFDKAIHSADAMVSVWQQFGKNLPPLLADAINYGGTREADELNNAYEAYDFNKFIMLHPKVEAFVKIGARLAKTQDYTTPGTDNYNILVGTGNAKIISDMEHAVAARDVNTAELLIDNAINIVNTWHDIVTSANEMKANNVPRSLRDDIDRALATYNSAVWPDIKARYNEWDSHQKLIARVKELALFDTKSKVYAALLAEADGYVVTEDWAALQSIITKLEARKSQIELNRGLASDGKIWEGGKVPYTEEEAKEKKRLEDNMLNEIKSNNYIWNSKVLSATEAYENYIHKLSEKYHDKRISKYSANEIAQFEKRLGDYLKETPMNPKTPSEPKGIWGTYVGGVYNNIQTKSDRIAYAKLLGNVTPEELSVITRFTNGSTFSNAYHQRNTSKFWKQIWDDKVKDLDAKTLAKMEQIIDKYPDAAAVVLEKMRRYDGVVFRGMHSGGAEEVIKQCIEAWDNGTKTWINPAPASTSTRLEKAQDFDDRLILIIHNKTGAYIQPISIYKSEYEVMIRKGDKYRILSRPYEVKGVYYVELEEII